MAVGASGTISSGQTTKLISMADAQEAMKMAGKAAGAYVSPMG